MHYLLTCLCVSFFFLFMIEQANIADYGDNQWVTCFQESAEAILGQNAAYLGQLKESVRPFFLNLILASGYSRASVNPHKLSLPNVHLCSYTCIVQCFLCCRINLNSNSLESMLFLVDILHLKRLKKLLHKIFMS